MRVQVTLLLIAAAFAQQQWSTEKGVLVLNNHNFEAALKHFHILLVDFYAPWCPHCQQLEPQFALAAQDLAPHKITLAKVDCTTEHYLASRFSIHGYPTLKIFTNEVEFAYHGRRSHQDIVDYMIRHQEYIELAYHSHLMTKVHYTKETHKKHNGNLAHQKRHKHNKKK